MNKYLLIFLSLILFDSTASAQLKTKYYSTPSSNNGNQNIILSRNHGYIITSTVDYGSSYYTAFTFLDSSLSSPIIYELKDSLWGGLTLDLTQITASDDGGYLFSGGFYGYYSSTFDMAMVKTDSALNIEWYKCIYNGIGDGKVNSVVKTTDGNLSFNGSLKTDGNGNIIWHRRNNYPTQTLVATSSNGFINAGNNIFVKSDSLCNPIWANNIYNRTILKAISTFDGGYAFAGFSDSSGYKSLFLFRTDTSGTITFSYKSSSSVDYSFTDLLRNNIYLDLFQLSDSNFIIGFASNYYQSILLKIDQSGQLINARIFGFLSPSNQRSNMIKRIIQKSDRVYTFMEDFPSHVSFHNQPLTAEINLDDSTACYIPNTNIGWSMDTISTTPYPLFPTHLLNDTVYYRSLNIYSYNGNAFDYCNVPTNINDELSSETTEVLYHPSSDELIVEINDRQFGVGNIIIFDYTGKLQFQKGFQKDSEIFSMNIKTEMLPTGVYLIEVILGENIFTKKIIK